MTAVYHDPGLSTGLEQFGLRLLDTLAIIVRTVLSTAENDKAIGIARSIDNCSGSTFGYSQKMVG